ncbi:MAG: hypothetical protein LBC73_10070 [Oscillospiraceae bacterium]|nr:hypothetical protein [Oscillospiraceae bacterium]
MNNKIPYVKSLIEMATTVEDADAVITKHMGYNTYGKKLAFVTGTFQLAVESRSGDEEMSEETREYNDYYSLLAVLIDRKWR